METGTIELVEEKLEEEHDHSDICHLRFAGDSLTLCMIDARSWYVGEMETTEELIHNPCVWCGCKRCLKCAEALVAIRKMRGHM